MLYIFYSGEVKAKTLLTTFVRYSSSPEQYHVRMKTNIRLLNASSFYRLSYVPRQDIPIFYMQFQVINRKILNIAIKKKEMKMETIIFIVFNMNMLVSSPSISSCTFAQVVWILLGTGEEKKGNM